MSPGGSKPATCGRNQPDHMAILPKSMSLTEIKPGLLTKTVPAWRGGLSNGGVISDVGYGSYLRTGESGGGFRSSAENNGQAGGLTWGAGTMVLGCLGRSLQPLICCRVRIQTSSRITERCFVFTPGKLETVQARVQIGDRGAATVLGIQRFILRTAATILPRQ